MNDILNALLLGIIQGLTEFLPVSSSGHLLLLNRLGVSEPSLYLNLLLHLATLLASVIALRKSLFELIKKPFQRPMRLLAVASIPTAIIGVVFKLFFEELLLGKYLSIGFFITSLILGVACVLQRKNNFLSIDYPKSIIVGIMQGVAVLPGISRSGATVATLTVMGVEPKQATEFSFILGMPIIFAGAVLEIATTPLATLTLSALALIIGFISAFLTGVIAVKLMLKCFSNVGFLPFAIYTLFLGIVSAWI